MKILLTGGGTLGPVTPLLAVAEAWKQDDPSVEFVWIGTPHGPERAVVERTGMRFVSLASPKLDRTRPWRWIFIPFLFLWSLKISWYLLQRERPNAVVTAGGYVSVPIVFVASLLGLPSWVHQQDVRPGLANRLMALVATRVSTAWPQSLNAFPKSKTVCLGNPVRASILRGSREAAAKRFHLDASCPTILVFGGGTGSTWINHLIADAVPVLVSTTNVVHLTGVGKAAPLPLSEGELEGVSDRYKQVDLVVDDMADLYALADVVVCRAGMGTITELAALKKAAIVIPLPGHQEDNAAVLKEVRGAMILPQGSTPEPFVKAVQMLLGDEMERRTLGQHLYEVLKTERVAETLAAHIKHEALSREAAERENRGEKRR